MTAPTASGAEAACPENRVKALDVLSWPRVGVRSPESTDVRWGNRPRYGGKAVGIVLARYYDPAIGQFLTVDPKVATTLSPYGYVAGDPINREDPGGTISPGDLSPAQFLGLAGDCGGLGSDAGACMAAAFCPDQIACFTTGAQLFGSAESLATQAAGLPTGCTRSQVLGQAKELTGLATIAELSANYYSGGSLLNHLSTAGNDAFTGAQAGGLAGAGIGCALTWPFCLPGAGALGVIGGAEGAIVGALYGVATGRSTGELDELYDLINSGIQEWA